MIDSKLLATLKTKTQLLEYLEESKTEEPLYEDVLDKYYYERLLLQLQAELVDFQKWVQKEDKKIAIFLKIKLKRKVCKMKKVNRCSPFCPKSTMNLTYLCYGETNLYVFNINRLFFR